MQARLQLLDEGGAVLGSIDLGTFNSPSGSSLLTLLSAYYKLDETSGTRADSTPNGLNLTSTNGVGSAPGIIGNAASFTGSSSQSLNANDNALLRSTAPGGFTIACWINQTTEVNAALVGKDVGGSSRDYDLIYGGAGNPEFVFFANDGSQTSVGLNVAAEGSWSFVVAWYDPVAETINAQVNNGTVQSASFTKTPNGSNAGFSIGGNALTAYCTGLIDEVGIWQTVLTSTQRTNLYNGGAGVTYPFTGVP